jgi:hypothetical protein
LTGDEQKGRFWRPFLYLLTRPNKHQELQSGSYKTAEGNETTRWYLANYTRPPAALVLNAPTA